MLFPFGLVAVLGVVVVGRVVDFLLVRAWRSWFFVVLNIAALNG